MKNSRDICMNKIRISTKTIENIKMNQIEILALKNIISELKN